jgi:glutamine amidotransferase
MAATAAMSASEGLNALSNLSHEHPDGWGVAMRVNDQWCIARGTMRAAHSEQYAKASLIDSHLVIAHVRKKTVGPTALTNTHPFRRGRFVFAHNGTIKSTAALAAKTAPEHLERVAGDTDSEQLFAFVLTHIDEAGGAKRGIAAAVRALHQLGDVGSATFLFSCGDELYAHRAGRTLYTSFGDGIAMVASEPLSSHWVEVPERALLVIEPAVFRIAA